MIKIVSDSTCDLSAELLERYQIRLLPLFVRMGETEVEDGPLLKPEDIYAWSDANKTTPKTAAPSVESACSLFRELLEDGNEIIAFSISKSMSASYSVMLIAAEELDAVDRIHVIDSENLSTGIGLLIIEAAEMAAAGSSAEEIVREVEALRPRVRASFVLDTLTYLHRGGRCSGVAAMAGGILKLHPKIVVSKGSMHPDKKYRGKMEKVALDYAKDMEDALKNAKPDRVFFTNAGVSDEIFREICGYLESLHVFKEILITRAGGVISSHCGPGCLGVLFIEGETAGTIS